MGGGSSSARRSFEGRQSSVSSNRVHSRPLRRNSAPNRKEMCTESPKYVSFQSWLHPQKGGWTTTGSTNAEASFDGCPPALPFQVEHASVQSASTQIDLGRVTQSMDHSDCRPSNSPGEFDSPKAAVVSAMVWLLDMLEAGVTAGRSKLPPHALPFLVKCRESIASCQDDVRQCASSLHALGAQLQSSCTKEVGHTRVPEVELVYQLVLRIREASPGSEIEVAESLLGLAQYYRVHGCYESAIKYFQRLVRVMSCHVGYSHPSVAAAFNSLAESQAQANHFGDAEYACKRAIIIASAALGEEHDHTRGYRRNLEAVRAMKKRHEMPSRATKSVGSDRWRSAVAAVQNMAAPA